MNNMEKERSDMVNDSGESDTAKSDGCYPPDTD